MWWCHASPLRRLACTWNTDMSQRGIISDTYNSTESHINISVNKEAECAVAFLAWGIAEAKPPDPVHLYNSENSTNLWSLDFKFAEYISSRKAPLRQLDGRVVWEGKVHLHDHCRPLKANDDESTTGDIHWGSINWWYHRAQVCNITFQTVLWGDGWDEAQNEGKIIR